MAFGFSQEKLFGYPLKSGSVSFGKINAQNANAFFVLNNSSLLSGSISYETISVTIESLKVGQIPFPKPTISTFGTQTFDYQGKVWTVLDVTYGTIFNVGTEPIYSTYTVTGVDLQIPQFSVG